MQTSLIQTLQQDNQDMAHAIQSIQNQLQQARYDFIDTDKLLKQKRKENDRLKKKIGKQSRKLQAMTGDWDGTGSTS